MNTSIHPRLQIWFHLADALEAVARNSSSTLRKAYKQKTRQRRGATLRPGVNTPLWNELVKFAAPTVLRYGDQAKLGRFLGVPRQRVHEYLIAKTAYPDTERALRLLIWVQARHSDRYPT